MKKENLFSIGISDSLWIHNSLCLDMVLYFWSAIYMHFESYNYVQRS